MKEWQLKEAKVRFSEVVADALKGEEQVILKDGKRAVVVVAYNKYTQLVQSGKTLLDTFSSAPKIELNIERNKTPIQPFELE